MHTHMSLLVFLRALHLPSSQGSHSSKISNVRGEGTFLAFDMVDGATRDKFLSMARHNGTSSTAGGRASACAYCSPLLPLMTRLVVGWVWHQVSKAEASSGLCTSTR